MASKNRLSAPGLIDQARAEPWRFGFFQLVRLLRLHYSRTGRIDPENRPHQDPLRFRSLLSLNFPPSEISAMRFEAGATQEDSEEPRTDIEVTFMGLVGPSGVMPRPYTELLINRHIEKRDDAAHAFMDMFSHRATALFYEAWQKYRFFVEYERKGSADFEHWLLHLVGFTPLTEQRLLDRQQHGDGLRSDLFSWFSGLWSQRPRNASNLTAILEYNFEVPCQVLSYTGRWINLEDDQCSRLGQSNARLGQSAVAGNRVRDYQSTFRVSIGPMSLHDYSRLLPGTPGYAQLTKILRFYAGIELDMEIELILDKNDIPKASLGGVKGACLGRMGWLLGTHQAPREDKRALFTLHYDGDTA